MEASLYEISRQTQEMNNWQENQTAYRNILVPVHEMFLFDRLACFPALL